MGLLVLIDMSLIISDTVHMYMLLFLFYYVFFIVVSVELLGMVSDKVSFPAEF